MEQARAAQGEPVGSFSIYQLKGGSETLDYRFEPLDSIHRNGLSVKPGNYELVYTAPLTEKDNLESIYTRFNVDRPADFTGHSLSVSDIVVLHQDGKDTAHYCDRAGFSEVPEFLQPAQKSREITERIQTPRGSFYLCGMTREQMEADGYGFHHASENGKYLIIPVYCHLPQIRAVPPCGELRHLFIYEPFFLLRHIELHLNVPLSVCHAPPPFLIRVWGLACRLGQRFKAFHALRSPPETRAPASNFDCSGRGPEQRKIRKRVLACCAC